MIVLQAKDLTVEFANQKVLDNISLAVNDKEKIGLVGVNGSGKSTLLKCFTGQIEPDSGEIYISSSSKIGYLKQLPGYDNDRTAWDVVMDSFDHLITMRQRLTELELKMATADEVSLARLMEKYAQVTEEYERNNGYACENLARRILVGLGFNEDEFSRPISSFSGGQKTRLNIGRLLALEPDILFMDEPTNHLDMPSVEWLEGYLQTYKGTVIVVSHDRMFLDKVATRIIELNHNKLYSYPGNYSKFLELKAVNSAAWQKAYQKQQEYIKKTEEYIARFKAGIKSKQAQGRQKQLDRLERIENIVEDKTIARWNFKLKQESSVDVLKVEDVSKSYDRLLFNKVNINLRKGEKVALIGPNGCGKSTLLKIILGKILPDRGKAELGSRVVIGYFSQEFEDLDDSKTVLDEIYSNFDLTIEQTRSLLGRMLFTGDDVFKTISNLSGGEKARVSILKLLLTGANFLVLDEPTNHLDIDSRMVVEDMLASYPGTILMVSHDRYFIDQIANQILAFEKGTLKHYWGNYSDYKLKISKEINEVKSDSRKTHSKQQIHRMENKEKLRIERKINRELNQLEEIINDKEKHIADIEMELTLPENFTDVDKLQFLSRQLEELQNELTKLYEEWDKLSQLADEYISKGV